MTLFHWYNIRRLYFHCVFIILVKKNFLKSDFRFYIEFYKNTFYHWEDSWDLLIHGKVKFGASSGHDKDLIILICYKTVHNLRVCNEIVLKLRMWYFTYFWEEAIKLVNFNGLKSTFFYFMHWCLERFKYRFKYKIQKPNISKNVWIFFKYKIQIIDLEM